VSSAPTDSPQPSRLDAEREKFIVHGRPVFLFERIPVPPAPVDEDMGTIVASDPSFLAPPERIKVEHIIIHEEFNMPQGLVVRPALTEREKWSRIPIGVLNYYNTSREGGYDHYGEHWLAMPYLLRRGHSISIEIENRVIDLPIMGEVSFHGYGIRSLRPYDSTVLFSMPAGTVDGIKQKFGGQNTARVSGREDVLITAITWRRHPRSEGWNPLRIGLGIEPSYGNRWHSPGGTARGAGENLPPLAFYSNIRGPNIAMFYTPAQTITMEQGDDINFEFAGERGGGQVARVALMCIIGTTTAK